MNPLDGFVVDPETLEFLGKGLERPECILAERDGTLWVADGRGGVMRIDSDGAQTLILQGAANTAAGFHDRLVAAQGVRRRMIWNIRGDFRAEVIGSSGLGYAALRCWFKRRFWMVWCLMRLLSAKMVSPRPK